MCHPQNGQLLEWPLLRERAQKKKKNSSVSFHVVTYLCQFMAQNSRIWGVKKIRQLFDISNILKNRHFSAQQTANR